MKNKIILLITVLSLLTKLTYSQDKMLVGLSATLQSSQFGIMVPMWLAKRFVIAPSFETKFVEKVGADISIGLVPRFYLNDEQLSPYFGLKIGTIINIPSSNNEIDTDKKFDFIGGLAFGAEYFFNDNFSMGVEAQGNFTKSDKNSNRFGNPDGINFNTATMIIATIYF